MAAEAQNRDVVLTRVFQAPRELVWRAWTEPARLAAWWGPHGFSNPTCEVDVRPGGAWRFVMRGPDGTEFPNDVRFVEVARHERLVYDHLENPWFRHQVAFTPAGVGTEVTVRMRFATPAERDEAVWRYGALEGLGQTLERLADVFAAQA